MLYDIQEQLKNISSVVVGMQPEEKLVTFPAFLVFKSYKVNGFGANLMSWIHNR